MFHLKTGVKHSKGKSFSQKSKNSANLENCQTNAPSATVTDKGYVMKVCQSNSIPEWKSLALIGALA